MFSLNENNRFYLCTQSTDLRKGFNTLCGVIRTAGQLNPLDGSVFIFSNRNRTTLKLLHWERGGFVIYHKRLESGRMSKLKSQQDIAFRSIRWDELVLLIEGVNINTKRRKRYNFSS